MFIRLTQAGNNGAVVIAVGHIISIMPVGKFVDIVCTHSGGNGQTAYRVNETLDEITDLIDQGMAARS